MKAFLFHLWQTSYYQKKESEKALSELKSWNASGSGFISLPIRPEPGAKITLNVNSIYICAFLNNNPLISNSDLTGITAAPFRFDGRLDPTFAT
jgi:hypothetical protein